MDDKDKKGIASATGRNRSVQLTHLTTLCGAGSCPTVYRTDRNTLVVQGYAVTAESANIDLPADEQLVEIPVELLAAAMRADM